MRLSVRKSKNKRKASGSGTDSMDLSAVGRTKDFAAGKNCSTSEKKNISCNGMQRIFIFWCAKRCKKAQGSVCLSDRKGRYAPGGCIGGSKIEPCLKQPLRLLKAASDGKSEAETPANGLHTEILKNPERYFQDRKKNCPIWIIWK